MGCRSRPRPKEVVDGALEPNTDALGRGEGSERDRGDDQKVRGALGEGGRTTASERKFHRDWVVCGVKTGYWK